MAKQSPVATIPPIPAPTNSGAASGASLDGISSDPNAIRNAPAITKVESNPPNLRDNGGSGGPEAQSSSPQGDRELRPAPADSSGPAPFTASDNILQTIASRFNKAREIGKNSAWRQLQTDLMNASPHICPGLIPYKDLLSAVADIEKEIKGSSQQVGKSNEQLLSEFLNGEGDITLDNENKDVTIPSGDESSLGSLGTA